MGSSHPEDYFVLDPRMLRGTKELSFSPVHKLHVDTQLLLAGNSNSLDIAHEFTLVTVPEPSGATLGILVVVSAIVGLFFVTCAFYEQCVRRASIMQ